MSDDAERNDPEANAVERRSPHPLDLPRLIGGVLADIRSIAEGMAVLPRVLDTLTRIEDAVDELNAEVHRMRQGVDGIGGGMAGMTATIEKLEPHLEDVTRVVHPLRRLGDRTIRRGERNGGTVGAVEPEPEYTAEEELEAGTEPDS